MKNWQSLLTYNPIPNLINSDQIAIQYFTRRDLLEQELESSTFLWNLPHPQKILRKQLPNGAWPRSAVNKHPAINVELIETWRNLRFLVDMYEFDDRHPQIVKAAEFVFSCQSEQGDFRGILANQYATYYTGSIISLLIKAGYQDDPRTEKGMQWLLSMRQNDGGWTIPMIIHKLSKSEQYRLSSEFLAPLEPDRSKPFSHNWTGMVIRAFAIHRNYFNCQEAIHASGLLRSRFFEKDMYTSYQDTSYWLRFEFPYWWNHLVSAMDSISKITPDIAHPKMIQAIEWLVEHQNPDGTWQHTYVEEKYKPNRKSLQLNLWISLSICKILKRLFT